MSDQFPPQPQDRAQLDAVVSVLGSVFPVRTAVYMSSPITTGKRFAEWVQRHSTPALDHPEYKLQHWREVVSHNLAVARPTADRLRHDLRCVVIDPTALADMPGWTQDDYRAFWGRVIERFASKVVFLNGWQYSAGCSFEFLVATCTQAETLTEDLRPLAEDAAAALMAEAIDELRSASIQTGFLKRVCDELRLRISRSSPSPGAAL